MVFNFLGPSTEDPFNWAIAASLTSFHTGTDSGDTRSGEFQSWRGKYTRRIVERFLNAVMHCFTAARLLLSLTPLCLFCGRLVVRSMFVSVTQKRGDAEFKLTCTTDNSRIPGHAPAIPVRIHVRGGETRWTILCHISPHPGYRTRNFVM